VAGVGTPLAMLLSIGTGVLAAKLLGWPLQQRIAVGAIVSVERGELRHGYTAEVTFKQLSDNRKTNIPSRKDHVAQRLKPPRSLIEARHANRIPA
jgi:hypothetical protein